MEPLTAGAIALTAWVLNKVIDWSAEKALDKAASKVQQLLKEKSPDTANTIDAVASPSALPPSEREDIGEAVLVESVKKAAEADPEIKAAVEALGNDAELAAKENPQIAAVLQKLTETVQAQRPSIINENWQGINFKNANPTISDNTFNFGSK